MTYKKYETKLVKKFTDEQKWKVIQFYAEQWEYRITKQKVRVKRVDIQCDGEITYFKDINEMFEIAINMLWNEDCENDTKELKKYIKNILKNK